MTYQTKKKIVYIGLIITFLLTLFAIINCNKFTRYKQMVAETEINAIDFSGLSDGVYYGKTDLLLVVVELNVAVTNGRIESVELIQHKNGRGEPAEILIDRVVESQRVDLDVVTGATASSKAILKSVEVALNGEE